MGWWKIYSLVLVFIVQSSTIAGQVGPFLSQYQNLYLSQAQNCSNIVIWPSTPIIETRNRENEEQFPRAQIVRDFVQDLEKILDRAHNQTHSRRKRSVPVDSDLVSKVCNDDKSTGNPWDEDIPRTAYRLLRGFLGVCDRLGETKTTIVETNKNGITNQKLGVSPLKVTETTKNNYNPVKYEPLDTTGKLREVNYVPVKTNSNPDKDKIKEVKFYPGEQTNEKRSRVEDVKYVPMDVVSDTKTDQYEDVKYVPYQELSDLKSGPFNNPDAKVWDFVQPNQNEGISTDESLPGIRFVGTNNAFQFVDPYQPVSNDGFLIQNDVDGGKIMQSFTPHGFESRLFGQDTTECTGDPKLFWVRDLVKYMDNDCWILGEFARKFYPYVHCRPGKCETSPVFFGETPWCFPGMYSTHSVWMYCQNLREGERFRRFSFNLSQSCGCRTC